MPTEQEKDPDQVLALLHGVAEESDSALKSFKKKLDSGALADPTALAREVFDLFSILTDVAKHNATAHHEHFTWASEVDTDLDEIKEELSSVGSTLLPEDAERLKATILALTNNLRTPTGPDDADVVDALRARAAEAIEFIDEATAEEEELDDTETAS